MTPALDSRRPPTPLWAWTLLAWLACTTLGEAWGRLAAAERGPAGLVGPSEERSWPAYPGVAALRSLPGIGDRRAVRLVQARWERGPAARPLALSDVHGIGPATEEQAERAWAALTGAEPGATLRLAPRPPETLDRAPLDGDSGDRASTRAQPPDRTSERNGDDPAPAPVRLASEP